MLTDSLPRTLAGRGVSRRDLLEFCKLMVATLALPPRYMGQVTRALEQAKRPVLVWLEFQDCAGNSESMLRSSEPPVADMFWSCFLGSITS
jgi:hydrogenase small subunit